MQPIDQNTNSSPNENPNDLLLASLAANDITTAIYALALRADVNSLRHKQHKKQQKNNKKQRKNTTQNTTQKQNSSSPESETGGRGPLHVAILNGNVTCAELILQNHADVDLQVRKKRKDKREK